MKHGNEYARRVKRLFHQLIRKFGKPAAFELTNPIEQLVVGILASCTSLNKAQTVFRKLRHQMVDLNELRVTPPTELAEIIGDGLPLAREKARRIVDALNDIRRRQDTMDLMFLRERGRREAREYLESLEGVDRSAAASVVLYSLGGHAIPVDDLMLYVLRSEEMVDPAAELAEVQGFLERHISAADTQAFAELLGRYAVSRGSRLPLEKLGELLRPPPPPAPVTASPQPAAPGPGKKASPSVSETKPARPGPKQAPPKRSTTTKPKRTGPGRSPKVRRKK